jgi:UDP-glucose 4-epimerase
VNEYGRAMLAIESLVGRWDRSTVLRVSNAYGPGQRPRNRQGVIAYWLSAIAEGSPVHLVGSDQVARDYIFVDDVIDALIAAHMSEHPPSVVNVGSGRPTTLADLLDQVRAVVAPIEVKVRRDPARSFDSPSTWLDVSLARQSLGWTPRTSVSEGLRLTWRWMNQTHPDRDPTNPGGHEADK